MKEFRCSIARKGFYAGPVFFIRPALEKAGEKTEDPGRELAALTAAADTVKAGVLRAGTSGKNGEIRRTVLSLLEDEAFTGRMQKHIKEDSLTAAAAVKKTAEELAEELNCADSEYIRSRQDDIRGLAQRLAAVLEGEDRVPEICSAVAAREISPAQLSAIEGGLIGGLLSEKGSPNSHAAILAGNLGVPYLYGNPQAVRAAETASFLILDGEIGTVTADPDEETKKAALFAFERFRESRSGEASGEKEEPLPPLKTKVFANIEGPRDIDALLGSGADGVGLFRTEFLFMGDAAPSEEQQYEAYRAVLEAMGEKEVIIRTADLGSDKQAPWLDLGEESNPALGLRGVRVSLARKDLFLTQLRALLRAALTGRLKVMFPMIASAWEIDEINACVKEAAAALEKEGVPYRVPALGIMIETPAAALLAEELAEKAAFFSIGTNDLTQYTLALDREARGLERYFDPCHEAVFSLIRAAAEAGHRHGVKTGVCGQLAADPEAVDRLIGCGVDELSVPVSRVRTVKKLAAEAERRLFKAEKASLKGVAAVADGELIPMRDIPDPAFSGGTLGECFGILPENGKIFSPVTGTVTAIAETGHAVTVRADDGGDLLIHAGIDTVKLGKEPFRHFVKPGEHVLRDQLLMEEDLEKIRAAGLSPVIVLVALQ